MSLNQGHDRIRSWLMLQLADLRDSVQSNLTEMDADKHHLADLEELASDVNVDDVIFEQFRSNAESIEQIQRAIERIDAGEYEQCEECGGSIGPERLEAIPFATQCVDCKRRAESRSR